MTSTENSMNGENLDEKGADWDGVNVMAETVKNLIIVVGVVVIALTVKFIFYWLVTHGR